MQTNQSMNGGQGRKKRPRRLERVHLRISACTNLRRCSGGAISPIDHGASSRELYNPIQEFLYQKLTITLPYPTFLPPDIVGLVTEKPGNDHGNDGDLQKVGENGRINPSTEFGDSEATTSFDIRMQEDQMSNLVYSEALPGAVDIHHRPQGLNSDVALHITCWSECTWNHYPEIAVLIKAILLNQLVVALASDNYEYFLTSSSFHRVVAVDELGSACGF
ncbi:hypothetical protein BJ165DRAFT_1594195 [Panaeolus papilionaceus]|nr:hypothetical protein BJ165DRAFT_1594195 [Panaeolus papilionaceus]